MKEIAPISDDLLNKCLAAISGTDAIIVGGQALAYWAEYFDVDLFVTDSGITKDLDVFGDRNHLMQMGAALNASPQVQNPRFISALIGTIEIPISDNFASNVDVIHTIVGIERHEVRRNALKVKIANFDCNMMHPMHVLESRLKNIAEIPEKRNEQGVNQAALAILVANRYIASRALEGGESVALKAIEKVVSFAKISAGKMAADFGLNLINAIPFDAIKNENFQKIRKPQIFTELAHLNNRGNLKTPNSV